MASPLALGTQRLLRRSAAVAPILLVVVIATLFSDCQRVQPLDTKPLDGAGMAYDTIKQLQSLKISPQEVAEMTKARQGGFSDASCVQILQIYRSHGKPFDAGDAVSGLLQVGVSETTVLELAKINQLGIGYGELQAMRLAGLSDAIVLEVARRHAEGKPVLSGASLATLKNTGLRESTLLELTRRGVPDSRTASIIAMRRHGVRDQEILRKVAGS
ncbi:MAG TPA: hypothetical protein VJR23_07630 [Candidatus Acidoferrales bacterium]|nr:hypothetical protein [Candidatus Acidoferrales bacterium]